MSRMCTRARVCVCVVVCVYVVVFEEVCVRVFVWRERGSWLMECRSGLIMLRENTWLILQLRLGPGGIGEGLDG